MMSAEAASLRIARDNGFNFWPRTYQGFPATRTSRFPKRSVRELSPKVSMRVGATSAMCRASSSAYLSAPPSTPLDPNRAGTICRIRGCPLADMGRAYALPGAYLELGRPENGAFAGVWNLAAAEHIERNHLERDRIVRHVNILVFLTKKEVDGIGSLEKRQFTKMAGDAAGADLVG